MPDTATARRLAEELSSMIEAVPDAAEVVRIAAPDVGTVQHRMTELLHTVAEASGREPARPEVETGQVTTVMRLPDGMRATGFHASGAMSVDLGLAPFDDVFGDDPGDDRLVELSSRAAERLGLDRLLPEEDTLAFERLWRIKAAGADDAGRVSDPTLCRAVGAFRHSVRDLPVYGRASATVGLAADGRLASMSVSARRFAGDGGGETVERTLVRRPDAAAADVAAGVLAAFGDLEDLSSVRLVPEWFRFGYLSLGRRRAQGLLAPFYVAAVAVQHEHEVSAHVVAVRGSEDQYLRLPSGQRTAALVRQAA